MLRGGASGFLHLPVSSVLQRPPFRKRPPTASAAYKLLDLIISKYDHKYDIQSKQQMLISQSKVLFLLTRSPVPPSLFLDGRGLLTPRRSRLKRCSSRRRLKSFKGAGALGNQAVTGSGYTCMFTYVCVYYMYIYIYI